jgi:hypothetical protein
MVRVCRPGDAGATRCAPYTCRLPATHKVGRSGHKEAMRRPRGDSHARHPTSLQPLCFRDHPSWINISNRGGDCELSGKPRPIFRSLAAVFADFMGGNASVRAFRRPSYPQVIDSIDKGRCYCPQNVTIPPPVTISAPPTPRRECAKDGEVDDLPDNEQRRDVETYDPPKSTDGRLTKIP